MIFQRVSKRRITHSDKAVFLQLRWLRSCLQITVFVHKTLDVAGSVNLIHAEVDSLHALQVGWRSVGEYSGEIYVCIVYENYMYMWRCISLVPRLKGQPGDEVRGTCIYSMQNMGEPTCTFAVDRAKLHCITWICSQATELP